jgi:anti-sigma-K factor RskA
MLNKFLLATAFSFTAVCGLVGTQDQDLTQENELSPVVVVVETEESEKTIVTTLETEESKETSVACLQCDLTEESEKTVEVACCGRDKKKKTSSSIVACKDC